MKHLSLALLAMLLLGSSEPVVEANIKAKLTILERPEIQIEIPQPNGLEVKQVSKIYIDRIVKFTYDGETIYATNTLDTSNAVIKIIPVDPRRNH